jgi:flagellar biosynthesis protein FlhB
MDESELDKSEQASAFKLKKAREKGSVARSLDLGFFAVLAGAIGAFWIGGDALAFAIARASAKVFASSGNLDHASFELLTVMGQLFSPVVAPLFRFAVSLFVVALVLDFLQVGPVFSATSLKPDFSRINPAKGIKRLFSLKMLLEGAKSVLKLAVYATIAWLVIRKAIGAEGQSITNGAHLLAAMASTTIRLLMYCGLAALAFAALDQTLVRRDFAKRMRMSRRELRREHRDQEGEPRLKQKRKQIHAEFRKLAKSLREIRGSDFVIVNPDHYAVALRYQPGPLSAPRIVARGADHLAQRIKRVAFTYNVIIVQKPELARALFRRGRLTQEIPEDLFQSVADIYLEIERNRKVAAQ